MPVASRPNVLLIMADQHRYDCAAPAGHPLIQTPTFDRLAAEGVWFTHAFTPIATCCPARQSLLCGRWAEQHGGLWNYGAGLPIRLFDEPTWTESLARAGYRLGYVGKWEVHPTRTPLDFGFVDWITRHDYATWRRAQMLPEYQSADIPALHGHVAARWFGGVDPVDVAQSRTHWYAEQAIALIRRYQGEGHPWHIRLDFEEPHLPCYPAGRYATLYPPEAVDPWGSFGERFEGKPYIQQQQLMTWGIGELAWREWAHYVSRYLGMVSQVDDAVGRVLDALDVFGLAESTLVIYTSDHGDLCGGHRMIDKHHQVYEDVVRVPLIVRGPGVAVPGTRCDAFVVHALDLASTICEMTGLSVPETYQGRSLSALLRGEMPADWRQDVVSTFNGSQFGPYAIRMLRDWRFKYAWNLTDVDELYDLATDPWELRNLVDDPAYAEILQVMRRKLLDRLTAQGDPLVRTEWMRRQLSEGLKAPVGGWRSTMAHGEQGRAAD